MFDADKTRMIVQWKNYDNVLSRLHLISERCGQTDRQTDKRTDRQTDKRTDGRTDRQNCYMNIACQCADAR